MAFQRQTANVFLLRKDVYREVREKFGLSSQQAQLAIKAVSDVFKRDKSIRVKFRPHAAIAYDARTMSFKGTNRVSLLSLEGRIVVPFILGKYQADRIGKSKGRANLVLREGGQWSLIVTIDVPEGTPIPVKDFIGVDLGIAAIATDSDGGQHSGRPVDDVRRKHNFQRRRLQKKGTRGAKKKLKRVGRKEARFRKEQNHAISKTIVESARGTHRGIGLEELKGIRARITAKGGDARNRLGGWAFGQLGSFIEHKAKLAGIPLVYIDPRNTSRSCSECGHCEKANRKNQGEFSCKACGMSMNADWYAALNIRFKALAAFEPAIGLVGPRAQPEITALMGGEA